MTKEEVKKLSTVLKAYSEGKTIQIRTKGCELWDNVKEWNESWDFEKFEFRILKQPKYRPYANAEEFFKAQKEHGPYLRRGYDYFEIPLIVVNEGVRVLHCSTIHHYFWFDMTDWTWQDGTRCAIMEEE